MLWRRSVPAFPALIEMLTMYGLRLQVLKKNQEGNTSVSKLFS